MIVLENVTIQISTHAMATIFEQHGINARINGINMYSQSHGGLNQADESRVQTGMTLLGSTMLKPRSARHTDL